jgi:CheY-like chemotaxis protein
MIAPGGVLGISLHPVELTSEDLDNKILLSPGSYLQLEVSDTGHGMTKDVRERIFEPYFTTKGPGEGTGLGLAIVHGLIMNFGGDIFVYSEPGKGSTFRIYLPVVKRWKDFAPPEETTPLPTGTERILLVDDDEDLTRMTKTILEQLGYKVTALTSSVETLEMFRQEPDYFDLLISDLTMPNLTGTELAEQILAIRPEMPIILCSGYSQLINAEQAKNLGIRDYIVKPVIKRDFARIIRKVLDKG